MSLIEVSPNHRVYGRTSKMPLDYPSQLIYEGPDISLAEAIANAAMQLGYAVRFVKGGVRPFWVEPRQEAGAQ